jgi:hypothetical protein
LATVTTHRRAVRASIALRRCALGRRTVETSRANPSPFP